METTIFNLTEKNPEVVAKMEKGGFVYQYTCTRSKESGIFGVIFFNRIDPATGEVVGKLTKKYETAQGFEAACTNVELKCPATDAGKAKDEPKQDGDTLTPVKKKTPKKAPKVIRDDHGMDLDANGMNYSDADPGL